MITLLTGENSYEINRELQQLAINFDGDTEKADGAELELQRLSDLLTGTSLFSQKRLVVIRELSGNKAVWDALPDWLERLSDDVQLVLVEAKPDKRTRTYKALQKAAKVIEHKLWTERNQTQAEEWVVEQASKQGAVLSSAAARLLVSRVGVNQWQLQHAISKIGVYEEVTEELIRAVIDARPVENVFELFETALKGDARRLDELLVALKVTEDPYMLFGLLSGQAFQLAGLAVSRKDNDVAKDFGVHPYALSRLRSYASERGVMGAKEILVLFAEADEAMKTSYLDPWLAIEQVLFRVAEKS